MGIPARTILFGLCTVKPQQEAVPQHGRFLGSKLVCLTFQCEASLALSGALQQPNTTGHELG